MKQKTFLVSKVHKMREAVIKKETGEEYRD